MADNVATAAVDELRATPPNEVRLAQLLDVHHYRINANRRREINATYNRAFWYAAGRNDEAQTGSCNEEHAFAVAHTLDYIDYLLERTTSFPAINEAWQARKQG